ncbi:hypothetical protein C1646_764521, partial [Rhizophagus diaphanus]
SSQTFAELWEENTDILVVPKSEEENSDLPSEEKERPDLINLDGLNNFSTEQELNRPVLLQDQPIFDQQIPQDIPLLQPITVLPNPMEEEQRIQQEQDLPLVQDREIPQDQDDLLFQEQEQDVPLLRDYPALPNRNNRLFQQQFIQQFLNQQNQQNQQNWGAFLPTFSGENQQDPVAWLRDYNAAAEANGWNDQDNPGFITTWVAGYNGNVNNFEDRFLRRFRTAAMIEAWTIELEQRVQGSDETVEHYVSVLQKLFTRVGGYNEGQKT